MGGWCGAFCFDANDYDITGAMFVTMMGKFNFKAGFSRDSFGLLTGAG